jgi:predicted nucleic acid-binding Zn ribbon protein
MPELINHAHCKVCDRAVAVGQDTCSPECARQYALIQKKRSRTVLLFYAAGAFLFLMLIFQLMGRSF